MNTLMRKETLSAPFCVAQQLSLDEDRYAALGAWLREHPPEGTVTLARGSSDHAAAYWAYEVMAHSGQLVTSLPLSLFTLYRAPMAHAQRLAVTISQSGRSPDLIESMAHFRDAGATTVAFLNDESAPLAAGVDWVFPLHAGPERSVAATKSFITALVAGVRLAAHWGQRADLLNALGGLPKALEAATQQDWTSAVAGLKKADRLMVIGRGPGLAIAQEAALKFKETCAMQAEAFSGAEFQHGPMALVDLHYPVLIFALRGPAQASLRDLAQTLRQHGAQVLLAAPDDVAERDLTLCTTGHVDLDPIAAIASFYRLVEALALARGLNPDAPRHLAKVTQTR